MKKQGLLVAVLLTSTLSAAPVLAEEMKPGLWEITHKTAVNGQKMPEMNDMLKDVPPEMQAQVKAMMAKNGAGLTSNGVKVCLSQEQIERNEFASDPQSDCKVTDVKRSGNRTTMKMHCTKPKGDGETSITLKNAEAWSSETSMTMEQDGKPQTIRSESEGRWLGSDCGDIKPAGKTGKAK